MKFLLSAIALASLSQAVPTPQSPGVVSTSNSTLPPAPISPTSSASPSSTSSNGTSLTNATIISVPDYAAENVSYVPFHYWLKIEVPELKWKLTNFLFLFFHHRFFLNF